MLKNPQVKRTLVHLAEEIIDGGGGGGSGSGGGGGGGGSGGVAAVGDDMVLGEAKEVTAPSSVHAHACICIHMRAHAYACTCTHMRTHA